MNAEEIHDQDHEHQQWIDLDQELEKLKKITDDVVVQEEDVIKITDDVVVQEEDVINKIITNQDNILNQHPMKLIIFIIHRSHEIIDNMKTNIHQNISIKIVYIGIYSIRLSQ